MVPVHVAQRQFQADVGGQRKPVNHVSTKADALTHGQRIELVVIEVSLWNRAVGGASSSNYAE